MCWFSVREYAGALRLAFNMELYVHTIKTNHHDLIKRSQLKLTQKQAQVL